MGMIAVIAGLSTALMWATGTLCSSRSSRMIGAASVVAWMMLTGLAANLAAIALGPRPGALGGSDLGWMFVAGAGNVAGLLLAYSALRRGKVGLVAPIVSTEGSIAAVLAVVAGETLGIASALLLAVIATGVALAAFAPEELPVAGERKSVSVGLATVAALLFGVSLYAIGRLGDSLPTAWALLPPRAVGLAAVTIPLASTRRLRLTRRALPLVVVAGLAEVGGFAFFVAGTRHSLAITAVVASQFAALATVAAYVLFHERLTARQLGGVVLIVLGVAALTAVRAS
jgi:drug/metabolite transporter (DMT)-like permease